MTPEEKIEQWRLMLTDRQRAYRQVFSPMDSAAITAVMHDLGQFCRGSETCVVPGDRDMTCVLEGRREVFLRIHDQMDLTIDQLLEKYIRPA